MTKILTLTFASILVLSGCSAGAHVRISSDDNAPQPAALPAATSPAPSQTVGMLASTDTNPAPATH